MCRHTSLFCLFTNCAVDAAPLQSPHYADTLVIWTKQNRKIMYQAMENVDLAQLHV